MSDFVILKKEERTSKPKPFLFEEITKKELILILKLTTFFAVFLGLIYLSVSRNSLLLPEILLVSGIFSILFFIHIISNR